MKLFSLKKSGLNPSQTERLNLLRLARTTSIGPITFHHMIDRFQSAGKALEALPELSRRGGRKKPLIPPPVHEIEKELEMITKLGGELITCLDEAYPFSLSATEDAPPVITVLGHAHLLKKPCLAIVGARNASLNGKRFAEKIAVDCGKSDLVIVSGMARGIDTHAHSGSLETGTVAVLAGGADVIYPRENDALYRQIAEAGAVVSENPVGAQPRSQDFPRRNRIISGLSLGVVVVEASLRSGSLITARLAAEQGRDVFAVPGFPGDPRAQGPNTLIRDGAWLVQDAQDIVRNLRPFTEQSFYDSAPEQDNSLLALSAANAGGEEIETQNPSEDLRSVVIENLSYAPTAVDDLIEACSASYKDIQIIILELELAGRLQRHPGNKVNLIDNAGE